ncbi:MAG: homoserine kinase [Pseudomonadota bacterium]
MTERTSATAFAPASIGNVGVGFDVLGLAIRGAGDTITVSRRDAPDTVVSRIVDAQGVPIEQLATDPARNTASIASMALWKAHGRSGGLDIAIEKGIPLQSGMGSSAASAVAAAVATNALLDSPLSVEELLPYALEGEAFASGGRHADNVAPSLLGGLVLCPTVLAPRLIPVSVPEGVSSILLHPELKVNTAESRLGLDARVDRQAWVDQQGLLSAFVLACSVGDSEMMGLSLRDLIVEPQRAAAVPCFVPVRQAALDAGAMAGSLSGSGPSIFALARSEHADNVAAAMQAAAMAADVEAQVWVSPLASPGASVT